MLTRCRALRVQETGLTLVELLTTMVIALVVLGAAGTLAVHTLVLTRVDSYRNSDGAFARVANEYVSRALRTAQSPVSGQPAFLMAEDNEVAFYAMLDTSVTVGTVADVPRKVRIWVDPSTTPATLKQQTWVADASSVAPNYTYTSSPRTQVLVRGILVDATHPLFDYQTSSDASSQLATPLTAADRLRVEFVEVDLRVKTDVSSPPAEPTQVLTTLRLPNLAD